MVCPSAKAPSASGVPPPAGRRPASERPLPPDSPRGQAGAGAAVAEGQPFGIVTTTCTSPAPSRILAWQDSRSFVMKYTLPRCLRSAVVEGRQVLFTGPWILTRHSPQLPPCPAQAVGTRTPARRAASNKRFAGRAGGLRVPLGEVGDRPPSGPPSGGRDKSSAGSGQCDRPTKGSLRGPARTTCRGCAGRSPRRPPPVWASQLARSARVYGQGGHQVAPPSSRGLAQDQARPADPRRASQRQERAAAQVQPEPDLLPGPRQPAASAAARGEPSTDV